MSAAECPLLAAVVPVRYAIGTEDEPSPFLEGFGLPELEGRLVPPDGSGPGASLRYVARPLRDGWCYLWLDSQARLVEYRVQGGRLEETPRAGDVVLPAPLHFLHAPAGRVAAIAWSPVRWSDSHYNAIKADADLRDSLMRCFTPAQAPNSDPEEWFDQIPEFNEAPAETFNWSCEPGPWMPDRETLAALMAHTEIQAVALVDDPWGVVIELAHLVRRGQAHRADWLASEGEERILAENILALDRQGEGFRGRLPRLADRDRLEQAIHRHGREIRAIERNLDALIADWERWMETLREGDGPDTMASAQSHFDPSRDADHEAMETLWSAALGGVTQHEAGATLVTNLLDPEAGPPFLHGGHSLWAALLGHSTPLQLADVQRLVAVSESLQAQDWETWAHSLNHLAGQLGHGPATAREGLFLVLATTVGPILREQGATSAHRTLVAGYLAAALARSGQRLKVEPVAARSLLDWMNEPSARAAGAPPPLHQMRPDLLPGLDGRQAAAIRLVAEGASSAEGNPFLQRALQETPLKSLLVLMNGLMVVNAGASYAAGDRSAENAAVFLGGVAGTTSATAATIQHFAELRSSDILARQGMSAGWQGAFDRYLYWGQITNFTLAVTAVFDAVYFGYGAWESHRQGDRRSGNIQAGMATAALGQTAAGAHAFHTYRQARQALHVGRATQAARTAARARIAPAVILSLTLVIVAGAVSLRFTRDNELEQWLRGTRFGSHPADWAGDLDEELGRLYQLLYQPRIALETREARNPRYGDVYRYRVLLVTFPAAAPFPGMFTLEATERWRTGLVRHDERSRTITEKDLDLDIGGAEAPDGPVYRLIYHDTPDGDRLSSLSGTLYYRPFPDLTLPPIRID